jgi:hypothetical protein
MGNKTKRYEIQFTDFQLAYLDLTKEQYDGVTAKSHIRSIIEVKNEGACSL